MKFDIGTHQRAYPNNKPGPVLNTEKFKRELDKSREQYCEKMAAKIDPIVDARNLAARRRAGI